MPGLPPSPEPEPAPVPVSPPTLATPSRTKGGLHRTILIIVGPAVAAGGIFQMLSVFRSPPEVERLARESDTAFNAANKDLQSAGDLLAPVLDAVEKDGLPAIRKDRRSEIEKAASLYASGIARLLIAAQKADEAAAQKTGPGSGEFFKIKAGAYRSFAMSRGISLKIARMVLDESIQSPSDLIKKVGVEALLCQELEDHANAEVARADKLLEDAKK